MIDTVEIEVGQRWSSPTGMVVTIEIVRPANGLDNAWVVAGANRAACLSAGYILENYWLIDHATANLS